MAGTTRKRKNSTANGAAKAQPVRLSLRLAFCRPAASTGVAMAGVSVTVDIRVSPSAGSDRLRPVEQDVQPLHESVEPGGWVTAAEVDVLHVLCEVVLEV